MTLLRRAPREVYRLYGEEEFFADAPLDERISMAPAGPGGQQLQRLAGATMLLAAVGAVGGLIAITGVSSVAGARRRGGARLAAATGSAVPTRSDVSRARTSSGVRITREQRTEPARSAPRADGRDQEHAAASRHRRARVAVTVPVSVATPAQVPVQPSAADMTASAPVVRRQPVQVEFGFER
jgi:hypothetical protein